MNEPTNQLPLVNAFLKSFKDQDLPILESTVGDTLIKPSFRKRMKEAFQKALIEDLNNAIDPTLGEVVMTADGLMLVASHAIEGCYVIQIDTKFKNLDYDPFDPSNELTN